MSSGKGADQVDGVVLAEEAVGGTGIRSYGPDALGSVVATYDSTGKAQNSYRYSPYGQMVVNNTVASTPYFTWVGALGYRQTTRHLPEFYVRKRHYSSILGSWFNVDPRWPSQPTYSYGKSNPNNRSDPSGTCVLSLSSPPVCTPTLTVSVGPGVCSVTSEAPAYPDKILVKIYKFVQYRCDLASSVGSGGPCTMYQNAYGFVQYDDKEFFEIDKSPDWPGTRCCPGALTFSDAPGVNGGRDNVQQSELLIKPVELNLSDLPIIGQLDFDVYCSCSPKSVASFSFKMHFDALQNADGSFTCMIQ